MAITPLPTPVPSRADPANFAVRADAFLGALPQFATEANQLADDVNQAHAEVMPAAAGAVQAAQVLNFQGPYNSGTTYAAGETVQSGGLYYVSLQNGNTGNAPQSSPAWWAAVMPMVLPITDLQSGWEIDCEVGVNFKKTVSSSGAFTIANPPASGEYTFFLEVQYSSGTITFFSGYTVDWPESIGGSAPEFVGGRRYKLAATVEDYVVSVIGVSEYD